MSVSKLLFYLSNSVLILIYIVFFLFNVPYLRVTLINLFTLFSFPLLLYFSRQTTAWQGNVKYNWDKASPLTGSTCLLFRRPFCFSVSGLYMFSSWPLLFAREFVIGIEKKREKLYFPFLFLRFHLPCDKDVEGQFEIPYCQTL